MLARMPECAVVRTVTAKLRRMPVLRRVHVGVNLPTELLLQDLNIAIEESCEGPMATQQNYKKIDVHGSGWRHPDRGGCGTTPVTRRANRGSNRLIRVLQIPQALLPAGAIKQRGIYMYIYALSTRQVGFMIGLVATTILDSGCYIH